MPGGRKVWATVDCKKHGIQDCRKGIPIEYKRVKVSIPETKKQRREGGCPVCKAEAIAEQRLQAKNSA